jgi:two-component system phosphate regulon response regulator PhoB
MAKEHLPNLILLDWMMPLLSGVEACRLLRRNEKTRQIPIIMVTARGEEADKVRALDVGADDYVTKPFSPAELIARVGAVLRRVGNLRLDAKLEVGDIVMDTAEFRVHRANREIHVGPTEYKILKLLMQNPGKVYSREQLLNQIWGQDVYVEIRTVDVHIRRLRVALNEGGEADVIRTVRSAGYALDVTGALAE